MKDNLVTCRKCGSNYCYEAMEEGKYVSWICMLCGFQSNTGMMANTAELDAVMSGLPRLYQDLLFIDEDGFGWVPMYKRVEGVGEVFATPGNTLENWHWTAAKHVLIPESEREMYKNIDGSYRKYKADISNALHFRQDAFPGALHYLGIL